MDMELTIEQLNEVVVRHEQTIDDLTSKLNAYQSQLQTLTAPLVKESDETPPPHY